ncbi:MAG: PKD domain-containing protein, partial [Methanoregulaceae archaeon]|nr:PKD domain-containing protein [Methanoregulaceae archaeon]
GCCSCPTFAFFDYTISGRTVTFSDKSTGNPVQWAWTFGNGGNSQLRNPVYTYSKSGTYTVTEMVKGRRCDGYTYWVSYKKSVKV